MNVVPNKTTTRIQSLARANAILEVIEMQGEATLASITKTTGLNKTTAFYLLGSLVDLGFVQRLDCGKGFKLGMRNLELGRAVQRGMNLVDIAKLSLTKLCLSTRETVSLAVPRVSDALIVESLEGTHSVRLSSYSGTRAPYHAASCGKVILANLDEATRHAIYNSCGLNPITPKTLTGVAALESQLVDIRRDGHGFDMEEMEMEARCVAVPIFDAFGQVVAAISVAGPKSRMTMEWLREIAVLIKVETIDINKRLGSKNVT